MFSIRIHHGGRFHKFSGRRYVDGAVDIFDLVDIELYDMYGITYLQFNGAQALETQDNVLPIIYSQFRAINMSSISVQPNVNQVIDDVIRHISFDDMQLDGETGFGDVAGSSLDSSVLSHGESFRVDDLDLYLTFDLNVPQIETQKEVHVSENEKHVVEQVRVDEVVHSSGQDPIEYGNGEEFVEHGSGQQVQYDVDMIDRAYETHNYNESSEDACTYDDDDGGGGEDDDDDDGGGEGDDILVDEENKIVEPDVDVHLFGEDVDVVNVEGFDSDTGYDDETGYHRRRIAQAKAEKEVRGDHTLQYAMLRDYVVELQSTNPNTTVKIVVESVYVMTYIYNPNSNFAFISDRQKEMRIDRGSCKHDVAAC
nr:transposase, mutator type [Tanacetum cinerariifolium]